MALSSLVSAAMLIPWLSSLASSSLRRYLASPRYAACDAGEEGLGSVVRLRAFCSDTAVMTCPLGALVFFKVQLLPPPSRAAGASVVTATGAFFSALIILRVRYSSYAFTVPVATSAPLGSAAPTGIVSRVLKGFS